MKRIASADLPEPYADRVRKNEILWNEDPASHHCNFNLLRVPLFLLFRLAPNERHAGCRENWEELVRLEPQLIARRWLLNQAL